MSQSFSSFKDHGEGFTADTDTYLLRRLVLNGIKVRGYNINQGWRTYSTRSTSGMPEKAFGMVWIGELNQNMVASKGLNFRLVDLV